uniref:Nuclear shuttle protein n=1 Tax=Tomato yellow leaf curl Thailand virus TaxID=85752 RepID=D5KYZ8_9GEMI|nr:BV1 protein [Tomato yellow leaf curl Thailand virus]
MSLMYFNRKMRVPIRRNSGFNAHRRPSNGSINRWNYPYSGYFGKSVGNRVYGMPFGSTTSLRRPVRTTVRRNLFSDQSSSANKGRKTIEEVHDGSDYLLRSNTSKVSYISYPPLSRSEFGNRLDAFVKILGFNVSGSVALRHLEHRDSGAIQGIHGIYCTAVVRDKRPCQFSAVEPILPFPELFGLEKIACSSLRVRDSHRSRFSLVYQKKVVVNSSLATHVFKFNYCVKFNRFPFWVSFKDTSDSEPSGLYSNVSKNALIVYYVWLCDSNVTADSYVKYDLNYIG